MKNVWETQAGQGAKPSDPLARRGDGEVCPGRFLRRPPSGTYGPYLQEIWGGLLSGRRK